MRALLSAGIVSLILAYLLSQFYRAFLAVLSPVLQSELGAGPGDLALSSGLWFVAFAAMQIPIGSALDFGMVLDEMYRALNDELDFDMEVRNLEEFRTANRDVAYVGCPEVFEELCSDRIIVMEHIGGWQVDDAEGLKAAGYDLDEIAVKLVNNYIKQIVVDRFFHADPHCIFRLHPATCTVFFCHLAEQNPPPCRGCLPLHRWCKGSARSLRSGKALASKVQLVNQSS